MMDVLCVGAHPDDVEIGMGGTVANMTQRGLRVGLLDLTNGEPTPFGDPDTREKEAREAAAYLGVVGRKTLGLPNRLLSDTLEARTRVAQEIRLAAPRILFCPYPHDAHPDHAAAATICSAARFWAKFTKTEMDGEPHYVPRVYQYFAVHQRATLKPSFVVDVSSYVDAKREALSSYASQFSLNPANTHVIDTVLSHMRYWGSLIGVDYGEPFLAPEQIGVSIPTDLV